MGAATLRKGGEIRDLNGLRPVGLVGRWVDREASHL